MMNGYISSPSNTASLLKQYDIRLKKAYGQNFLIDTNILKKITSYAGVGKNDCILEIGSGIGSLTEVLLEKGANIVCIELDSRMTGVFKHLFSSHLGSKVVLMEQDGMKVDYQELSIKYGLNKFVSNLPYKVAAPLILKVFCQADSIVEAYLTIQKDIADRITAAVGDKNYSSYTVKANYIADFKNCFLISRNCFLPRPNVDSSFIEAKRKKVGPIDTNAFFSFVDSCFAHRRKKLINSLPKDPVYQDKVNEVISYLRLLGKDESVRAEELSVDDYLALFKGLNKS
ncbi:MAG: 16S rRNA (adenine(1518)-N(6)/adenine(1519)-N(6))-dimethyltransferase RsmA [Actinomycetota bacterium]|nr:16S rRNA (adenine(1518)-N(6)/adenine(1519)-N(6))-dimethyltransferase RsmA [Actinomycetota bacterium]